MLDEGLAALTGWLGEGFRKPKKPYPWTALPASDRERYDRAVARLVKGSVPTLVAQIMCWGEGDWQRISTMVLDAEEVQVYPQRQHVRLVPKRKVPSLYIPPDARRNLLS